MDDVDDANRIRRADPGLLGAALADCRAATLRTFAAYEQALKSTGLRIPYSEQVNPPLWELGHVGWFQEYWIARNPQLTRGIAADPQAHRPASCLPDADALYDSGRVEHTRRWHLPLPDAARTRAFLAQTLDRTRAILAQAGADGDEHGHAGLRYFGWLALMHEDMHHEACNYMAQALGIEPDAGFTRAACAADAPAGGTTASDGPRELAFAAMTLRQGACDGDFAFDNELPAHQVRVEAFRIDRAAVSNAQYAAFIDDGGYGDARHWTADGWAWCRRGDVHCPRYWRRAGSGWQRCEFGRWLPLDEAAPVVNLSLHEAQAWCHWSGRRLPTESEWELAATTPAACGRSMRWGQVWEWTASRFRPYPSFAPHPYRDYSQPWFDTRQVLRGASIATCARLRHPRYRNFFTPDRNDIFAGFRTCAPAP
jgi:gamma-glutamyl hercynylcysteine S-oxide synthase